MLRTNTIAITTNFLYECILTRFGCPLTIVIGSRCSFSTKHLKNHFLLKHVNYTMFTHKGMVKSNPLTRCWEHFLLTWLTKQTGMNIYQQFCFFIEQEIK